MTELTVIDPAVLQQALAWAAPATAWMLTYLLHSTVLLGAAWLVSRRLAGRGLALEETLWRAALVGALVTASLQAGLGWRPVAGSWTLASWSAVSLPAESVAARPSSAEAVVPAALGDPAPVGTTPSARSDRQDAQRGIPGTGGDFRAATTQSAGVGTGTRRASAGHATFAASAPLRRDVGPSTASSRAVAGSAGAAVGAGSIAVSGSGSASASGSGDVAGLWPLLAVAAWLAVAAVLLASLLAARLRLAHSLRGRWPVRRGVMPALLGRLLERAEVVRPVRLTGAERLPVPIAFGLARPEICLPGRAVREMSPYHQESILAHELAHLLRRDPAWLMLARGMEAAFFFQPLNRLARRRLQEIAEYRCDDRAVELTGRPLELARCLTEVAAWRLADSAALPVPTMAVAGGSALARRVHRLLDGDAPADRRLSPWLAAASAAGLLALAALAPAVTAAPGDAPPAEEPPAVAVSAVAAPAATAELVEVPPGHTAAPEAMGAPRHPARRGTSVAPPRPPAPPAPAPRMAPVPQSAPAIGSRPGGAAGAAAAPNRAAAPAPAPAASPAPSVRPWPAPPAPAAAPAPGPGAAPQPRSAPAAAPPAVAPRTAAPAPGRRPTISPAPETRIAPAPGVRGAAPAPGVHGVAPAPAFGGVAPTPGPRHLAPAPRLWSAAPAPGAHGAAPTAGIHGRQATRQQRVRTEVVAREERANAERRERGTATGHSEARPRVELHEERARAEQRRREVRVEQREPQARAEQRVREALIERRQIEQRQAEQFEAGQREIQRHETERRQAEIRARQRAEEARVEQRVRAEQRVREQREENVRPPRSPRQGVEGVTGERTRDPAHAQRLHLQALEEARAHEARRAAERVRVRSGGAEAAARLDREQAAALEPRLRREIEGSAEHRLLLDAMRQEHERWAVAAEAEVRRLREEMERETGAGAAPDEESLRALAAARAELEREIDRHREETARALEAARRELERQMERDRERERPAGSAGPQNPLR